AERVFAFLLSWSNPWSMLSREERSLRRPSRLRLLLTCMANISQQQQCQVRSAPAGKTKRLRISFNLHTRSCIKSQYGLSRLRADSGDDGGKSMLQKVSLRCTSFWKQPAG